MNTNDVRTEMRKLADSKPVHAAAGVGVLATETLRELPARIAKWRDEATVTSLSTRATEYVTHARARAEAEYDKARTRAMGEYDKARARAEAEYDKARARAMGEYDKARARAMGEYDRLARLGRRALSEHATTQGKAELNGKAGEHKAGEHKATQHKATQHKATKATQSRTSHR
jgi:regulator of protease activity HflC (stomatin/prohibitin superfamily)